MRWTIVVAGLFACAAAGCSSPQEPTASEAPAAVAADIAPPVERADDPLPPAPSVPEALPVPVPAPAPAPASSPPSPPASSTPAPAPRPRTVFENSAPWPKPPSNSLGTKRYPPTPAETPFLTALAKAEQAPTGEPDYTMTGRVGDRIGWLGVVRGISEDAAKDETRLLVEMKYFDGLTDGHILCVSFNGAGDFVAILDGTNVGAKPLSLVRVYGAIESEKDGVPRVRAEFVRHFDQPRYCFMFVSGNEKGNPQWRKLNRIDLQARDGRGIYNPFPGPSYYDARLGSRADFAPGKIPVPQD